MVNQGPLGQGSGVRTSRLAEGLEVCIMTCLRPEQVNMACYEAYL